MEQDQQSLFNYFWTVKFTINRGYRSNRYSESMRLLRSAEDSENEDLITAPQTNPALANFSGMATVVVVANKSQWFGDGQVAHNGNIKSTTR